jgi:hypothetical protein
MKKDDDDDHDRRNLDANRDPLNGATCAHPVGTVVGGMAGKGAAEAIDPTRERAYWSENFRGRDCVEQGASFDDYGTAYGFGVEACSRYSDRHFGDVESEMLSDWTSHSGVHKN